MRRPSTKRCRRCRAVVPRDALFCPACGTLLVRAQPWSWPGPVPPRPAGWYADPAAHGTGRYWDGSTWTDLVTAATPDMEIAVDPAFGRDEPHRRGFSGEATGIAVAGLCIAFGLSALTAILDGVVDRPGGILALLVVSEAGLWVGLFTTCRFVSARYGSGRFRADFGLRFRPIDAAIGLGGGIVARVIATAIAAPFSSPIAPGKSRVLGITIHGPVAWTIICLVTCVGAPFFEELFFRGTLQTSLTSRFGPAVGVVVTAIVFGSAHVFNAPGFAGVVYALSIMGAGLVLGIVFAVTRRLGASMAVHFWFNAIGIATVALGANLH